MARTINITNVKEQKSRIMDMAEFLFIQKGYHNTSVNKLLEELKIAKGTFYHYFTSKEDLLDNLIKRMYAHALEPIQEIIDDKKISAIEKFNRVISLIKTFKIERKEIMMQLVKILYREENMRWRYKIEQQSLEIITPEFAKIIKQGNKEKVFNVTDPQETAEIFLRLSNTFTEVIAPMIVDRYIDEKESKIMTKKILAYVEAMERILGVKAGTLNIFDMNAINKIVSK